VAQVESVVEPDCVGDDIWRESVALIRIHHQIISFRRFNLAIPGRSMKPLNLCQRCQ
jgi:hypothetical protein